MARWNSRSRQGGMLVPGRFDRGRLFFVIFDKGVNSEIMLNILAM